MPPPKENTRKKKHIRISDLKGPPPTDIDNGILRAKDWEEELFIESPVRHQQKTPFCWAIATATAVEILLNIKNFPERVRASPQDLIDNALYGNRPMMTRLFEVSKYIKEEGLCKEDDYGTNYPFKVNATKPKKVERNKRLSITDFVEPETVDENELIRQLSEGPVVAIVKTYRSFEEWKNKDESDIYRGPSVKEMEKQDRLYEHAIVLVGYGPDDGSSVAFFRCMNSFGEDWGCKGFGKISRNIVGRQRSFFEKYFFPILKKAEE